MKIKQFFIPLLAIVLLLGIGGCDQSTEEPYREQLVLSGFMFINKPMSVKINRTLPFSAFYRDEDAAVSGAMVTIWELHESDSTEFILTENAEEPGTYSMHTPGADDTVRTGRRYAIVVEAEGQILAAESGLAAPPLRLDSVIVDGNHIEDFRDSLNTFSLEFGGTEPHGYPYLELYWNHDGTREATNIVIQNLEPNWYDLEIEAAVVNSWPIAFWSSKGLDGFPQVPWLTMGFTGRHRITVMSCDENLYNYFLTDIPGTAENYPDSNVRGGLGIFGAIDADTVYFYLKDDIKE